MKRKPYDDEYRAYIYGLRVIESGRYFYVGCTRVYPQSRLISHLRQVKAGTHANRHFSNIVNLFGSDGIECDVLEIVPVDKQFAVEKQWINRMINDGHKLANRIHNGVNYEIADREEVRDISRLKFMIAYRLTRKAPGQAVTPDLQWLLNLVHEHLKSTIDSMIARFPDEVRAQYGPYEQHTADG